MTRLASRAGGVALLAFTLALTTAGALPAPAQQLEPITYTVRIPAPRTHYLEIEASYPTGGRPSIELMMAVWTPGSYLIREFARNVEGVSARSSANQALAIDKTRKNRWLVHTGGASRIVVSYRVYAHERAGRLDWVEDEFALINGAPTFITLAEQAHRPHEVALELPASWRRSLTALHATAGGLAHRYRAVDFDELVDSPIVAGNPSVHELVVDGVPHALVNVGTQPDSIWDAPRSVAALERIVRAAKTLWGSLPYERYLFFNFLTDSYDGIEHKGSTVLFADRHSTRTDAAWHDWLGLAAHEYTHAWNVKRLRPVELGPFDYENENYTRSLWIAEGVTDYYSWLLVRRTGLGTLEQGLADVSGAIRSLQTTPGRLVQPLELASFDAWIKQYRPDENSVNTSISYYTKGSVVGLLLDTRIRRLTNGARSLDDVMRLAYSRYSGARGYTPAQFRAVASEVAGSDLSSFFRPALESTAELEYGEMLEWYGLRFMPPPAPGNRGWLGIGTRTSDGRTFVTSVRRGTPAYGSGLDVGDEIVAIDDTPLDAGGLDARLAESAPGARVAILVARHGELHRVAVTLGTQQPESWTLAVRPDATPDQRAHLEAWMGAR
jgi:predicted metalloprotease with PDZ domain